jgi:hypothetical protein
MSNGCIAYLDAEVLAVLLEHYVGELGPIVSDDTIQDPKHADD